MLSEVFNIRPLPEARPGEEIRRKRKQSRRDQKVQPRRQGDRLSNEQSPERGQDPGISRYA